MVSHTEKNSPIIIAIDAMGGDHGPSSTIPGAAAVLSSKPDVSFLFFGDRKKITPLLEKHTDLNSVSKIVHTDKYVKSEDKPSYALKHSRDTSMRLAIEAVRDGKAHAVVSSGNTGALMAMAKMILKPLDGIHRPAIASVFPTVKDPLIILDLGANVLVDAENLVQFAVLGCAFAKARLKKSKPLVGLLNVGTEDTKGPDHVRAAAGLLSQIQLPGEYKGFVEGNDLTKGIVDVVVSDGYAGNIALKTAEGVGDFTNNSFKRVFKSDPLAMIGAFLSYFALKRFKNIVDPRLYNGGVFLGLNGICVKSHGGSDALAFSKALDLAINLVEDGYIQNVAQEINTLMSQEDLSFVS